MRPLLPLALLAVSCTAAPIRHSLVGDEAPDAVGAPHREAGDPQRAPDAPAPELQRRAEAQIHRDDPERGVTAAATLANKHGGWVESMENERVVVRLPDAELDAALDDLATLGEVAARRVQAVDVGDAHGDLVVRVDTLRKTRERYLDLLAKAQSIGEATAVEHEIERVTAQLERLEATLAAIEKRIAYSSLALEFSRRSSPGPLGWVFYGLYSGVKWLFVWN